MAISGAYALVQYYANLLILQYLAKRAAYQTVTATVTPAVMPQQTTVQSVTFNGVPAGGAFALSWNGSAAVTIAYNATASAVQTALRTIPALALVTVTGSMAAGLVVNMVGLAAPVQNMDIGTTTLVDAFGSAMKATVVGIDDTLPLAVQNGFNLFGPNPATGKQLDIIGKYCGVSRTGAGFYNQITLSDADFLTLIKMAIIKNNAGSSLATIQAFIHQFFPGQLFVFDYANMQMSYLINTSLGSQNLIQLFITEGLLPRPMAVQLAVVVYQPVINTYFGFGTYVLPASNVSPLNTYTSYSMSSPWLSYANGVTIPS